MAGFTVVTKSFDGIMYLIIISCGGLFMISNKISAGDMMAYVMYVTSLLTTVRRIVEFTEQFQRGMTGIERFTEIMDAKSEIVDSENAVSMGKVKGLIEFENVDFKYETDTKNVLEKFNLKINPGANLAIVGPSGAGKTTICNLIPRFYDVTSGSIKVDGRDVREIKLESLRNNIGIMQQDVYLFSGTVLENIRYGNPKATDEEVLEVAKMAGALEFIEKLPNGLETYVGERGVKLSGGQNKEFL